MPRSRAWWRSAHRDAFARRRAEALLSRAKRLAAKPRRAARSSSRSASALARDLRVRLAHRESHIVRLTERLAHQSQRRASAAAGGSFAAAAAELFRPANGPARADDVSAADDVSGATASAVAQLAAHRADVLAARAAEAGVTWLRDARDTEARAAAAARAEKQTAAPSAGFPFPSRRGRARTTPTWRGWRRSGTRARAGRARERRRARARDATARLLDARNREYVAATRERQARREAVEERKRLLARGASGRREERRRENRRARDASHPKRGAPRLAARRDGAENARPADARQDAKRQRRAPREMDPFGAHFNSSCES